MPKFEVRVVQTREYDGLVTVEAESYRDACAKLDAELEREYLETGKGPTPVLDSLPLLMASPAEVLPQSVLDEGEFYEIRWGWTDDERGWGPGCRERYEVFSDLRDAQERLHDLADELPSIYAAAMARDPRARAMLERGEDVPSLHHLAADLFAEDEMGERRLVDTHFYGPDEYRADHVGHGA